MFSGLWVGNTCVLHTGLERVLHSDRARGGPGISGQLPAKCGCPTISETTYLGIQIGCQVPGISNAHCIVYTFNQSEIKSVYLGCTSYNPVKPMALQMATQAAFACTFRHPALWSCILFEPQTYQTIPPTETCQNQ